MITKPGIYDIPMREYLNDPCPEPSVSAGLCKTILGKSVYHAYIWHPKTGRRQINLTEATDIGDVCHHMLLGGSEGFEVTSEFENYKTKAAREWRDDIRRRGKVPMLEKDFEAPSKMLWVAKQFLKDLMGDISWQPERTAVWREMSLWNRARYDILSDDLSITVDYKTCMDASPRKFHIDARKMGYALTAAHYKQGLRQLSGHGSRYIFLAQEKKPPYACSVHEFMSLEQAEEDRMYAMGKWLAQLMTPEKMTRPYGVEPYFIKEVW